jgi:integrase
MARTVNRIGALKVERLKEKGLHADGGGLYLRIAEGGSKGWIFRYAKNGRTRDMGLGSVNALSLAQAREKAAECRNLIANDIDPIERRNLERATQAATAAKAMSFRQCADAYITAHEGSWSNPAHRQQWRNSLDQHVHPTIGSLPVNAVDTALVMNVLGPLWPKRTETASRIRGRIESILDWAKVSGYRSGENPARWRGHLEHSLPARSRIRRVKHYAALPYAQVGSFVATLRQDKSTASKALQFLILTGGRANEVLRATWDEIDLTTKTWIVPAERMKARKEHRVPLSADAMAIVKEMSRVRQGDYIFPGRKARPMSHMTLRVLAKKTADLDVTNHGFRSSFRDWAAECTNFPREVAEIALAHQVGDETERAYQRGDLFDKRRKLMDAWAAYCAKRETNGSNIAVSIRARES